MMNHEDRSEPGAPIMAADIVMARARQIDGSLVDVLVTDGRIVEVVAHTTQTAGAATVHDIQGKLLIASLVEPHAHLDKAFVADRATNRTGDLQGAIDAMDAAMGSGHFERTALIERAVRAMRALVANGVTTVRTHVNVGAEIGAAYVAAIDDARRQVAHLIDVEIVALTHTPLSGAAGAGNRAALAAALGDGADVVGACPHLDADPERCISVAFDAAQDAHVAIDLHTDETLDPSTLTLSVLAREVQNRGFDRPVAASHCVSLSMQSIATQQSVAAELAAARVSVIPQPATNLYLQSRLVATAKPRAIAPIDVLREAGVVVAAGGDNMQDPFNPIGRGDPLETAALLVYAAHQHPDDAYRMVSNDARLAIGRSATGFEVGDRADFIAVESLTVREAIATASPVRMVFQGGRLVAETTMHTMIAGSGPD